MHLREVARVLIEPLIVYWVGIFSDFDREMANGRCSVVPWQALSPLQFEGEIAVESSWLLDEVSMQ